MTIPDFHRSRLLNSLEGLVQQARSTDAPVDAIRSAALEVLDSPATSSSFPASACSADPRDRPAQVVPWMLQLAVVPESGPLLFVLHLSDEALADDAGESLMSDLCATVRELAGDRAHVAVMTGGLTLDVLTDEQLAPIGLQHIPAPTLQVTPSPTHHEIEHPAGWHM